MLYNTFLHIPGVGSKIEQQIWNAGILSWTDWQEPFPAAIPDSKKQLISFHLNKYSTQETGTPDFYANLLPTNQHWRLFPHFRDKTAFFDIETNGQAREECEITTICLFDGKKIRTYIQGENLEDFVDDIAAFDVIVTYNGKSFDVPIIESYFQTRLSQVHIDLRHILYNLGYRGGLKGCEKQLGIYRHELDGVDGFFAVLLWQEYQRTDDRTILETLLAYNIADAVNLECLLVHAYNLNIAETPFRLSHYIPVPQTPPFPYSPDPLVIDKIKQRLRHSPLSI
jgi:uncharacterized protein YprB with RNaseH-like and TPR domain